jgi:hypothetical protein
MANATATPKQTTTNGAAHAEPAANAFVNTYGEMVDSFFSAQKKMMESLMGVSMKGFGVENASFETMRSGVSKTFHAGIDAMTKGVTEMTSLANDQVRFAGRVSERMVDTVCGPAKAQSPEAFTATMKTITSDCVENASTVANEMIKMTARQMEAAQCVATGLMSTWTGACKADCSK